MRINPGLVPLAAAIFLAATLLPVVSNALPRNETVPGGVAILPIGLVDETPAPQAHYLERRVMVEQQEGQWYAIVGISLNDSAGEKQLEVEHNGRRSAHTFNISGKEYEKQYITLKDKRKVNPYEKDLERISAEQKRSKRAYTNWRELTGIDTDFLLPVSGRVSGKFGKRRYFNGEARRPHSGVDIAAPEGTPILAPGSGTITETGDYFFNGKTIFIDHGQGLISMLCHLSAIDVKVGQRVEKGQPIGKVGMTGRATGPHLHWTISLNNSRIDPFLFVSDTQLAQLDHNEEPK